MKTSPPIYEIRIAGHLSQQWTDWFEGLAVSLAEDGNTLLTGPVADQAALHGLLKKVRDLGMPLLSVNQVPRWNLETNRIRSKERMNPNNKLIEIQDKKVTLSTLWVFVMFCIAYADIIGFIEPGTLEKIINDNTGFVLTPALILVFSLFQAIPIAMILVSRWFRRDVNRWLNIVASALTLLYVLGAGNWESVSYPVFAALEVVAMLGVIWLAWNWRNDEA
ncbi:MAG TPA: DUF6326 family protein [Anaerolineales bacterium]|nr:DUF6326 family protein [Anaerolineales bacterium]HLO30036.1 DUF6326 family protein [Anaerolineales bacterium]